MTKEKNVAKSETGDQLARDMNKYLDSLGFTKEQEETIKIIAGYIKFVAEVAEDAEMKDKCLKYPYNHQPWIHAELKKANLTIPSDAFVGFDEFSMNSKVTIIKKDPNNDDQIISIEKNSVVENFVNHDDQWLINNRILQKKPLQITDVQVREALDQYSVFIILPFLLVSAVGFSFNQGAKEEIVLSTC